MPWLTGTLGAFAAMTSQNVCHEKGLVHAIAVFTLFMHCDTVVIALNRRYGVDMAVCVFY